MESVTVGLDIGSSAVRAAEIQVAKDGRRVLRRFAQVGLPPGYVMDGEINNIVGVGESLRRLWAEGGFSTNEVVVAVSGPRVFVRQADVAMLSAEDLRSSLRFDGQELVPIAMEDACFDFSVLERPELPQGTPSADEPKQRILLVAAHRELLRNYTATLKLAGLNAIALDAAPLALIRAVPLVSADGSGPGVEVIVSIGAELTTVAVREDGIPRFIRSLTVGGAALTESIANGLHLEMAVAERLKRGAVPADTPQLAAARKAMSTELRDLAEEVRATIDFFLAQAGQTHIDRLLVTGGAAQTDGLASAITAGFETPVMAVDPTAGIVIDPNAIQDDARARIAAQATTAIGLALWPTEAPLIRLSVLPEEVAAARRARRMVTLAGAGLLAFAGLLGVASVAQVMETRSKVDKEHAAEAQVATLTAQVNRLTADTAVHVQAQQRTTLVKSVLSGDIDWARVLGQLSEVMPPGVHLTQFQGTRNLTAAAPGTTSGQGAGQGPGGAVSSIGTITFNVAGPQGGLPVVADWVADLSNMGQPPGAPASATPVGDLTHVWVSTVSVKGNGGGVSYTSTADLTTAAHSNRDRNVGKEAS